jgi:hypothetical protein
MASIEDSNLAVPTQLGDAGPYVRKVAGIVTGQLNTLAGQLKPLETTWTGDAYTYFNGLEQEWNAAAQGLFGDGVSYPGILGDIAHRLDVAWYNYCVAQQANTKMWLH